MYATPVPPVVSPLDVTSSASPTHAPTSVPRPLLNRVRAFSGHSSPAHYLLDLEHNTPATSSHSPSALLAAGRRRSQISAAQSNPRIPSLAEEPQIRISRSRTREHSPRSEAETLRSRRSAAVNGSSEVTDNSGQLHLAGRILPPSGPLIDTTTLYQDQNPPSPMTRHRAGTAHSNDFAPFGYMPSHAATTRAATGAAEPIDSSNAPTLPPAASMSTSPPTAMIPSANLGKPQLPSIRFVCHQDLRGARPSLAFNTITRILPNYDAKIRVGRYSERDSPPEVPTSLPSDAPIGFKSKVVSRRHCEFWYQNNQWFIKDVKSSSGTFLNHIRLSQPGVESRPWPIHDGDIIQLGIDFKGGEEMIFRCVKIRVECNRGWQKALNTFNKKTHKHLRNLAKSGTPVNTESRKEGDAASILATDCAICLMSIAPCQSLFVAPCSHTWHYKCIRPVINGPTWPQFQCPNCRAYADLEADIDEPSDAGAWDDEDLVLDSNLAPAESCEPGKQRPSDDDPTFPNSISRKPAPDQYIDGLLASSTGLLSLENNASDVRTSAGVAGNRDEREIERADVGTYFAEPSPRTESSDLSAQYSDDAMDLREIHSLAEPASRMRTLTASPTEEVAGTPRNNAGPFVLDGSHGGGMDSLDRAVSA